MSWDDLIADAGEERLAELQQLAARGLSNTAEEPPPMTNATPCDSKAGTVPDKHLSHREKPPADRKPDPEYGHRERPAGENLPPPTYQPR